VFNIIFSVILIKLFEPNGFWWFSGQILSQVIFTLVSGFYFLLKINNEKLQLSKLKFQFKDIRPVISFSLPLAVATFFLWATNESYRFILEKYLTLSYLGLIAVGIAISTKIATAIETLLHQLFHPHFFSAINTDNREDREVAWNNFFKISLPSYLSITIFMSFLSPFLLRLLSGKEFYDAWIFLVFGAILNLIRMITNHVALIAHSEYNTQKLVIPGATSAIISISLVLYSVHNANFSILVPTSLAVGALCGMIVMIYQMNKMINIQVNIKDIFTSILFGTGYSLSLFFFSDSKSLLTSIVVLLVSGLYFVATQFFFLKKNKALSI
jgi:O-antigen/teichoic acid export membrane protein